MKIKPLTLLNVVLAICLVTSLLFAGGIILGSKEYDPWHDINDDGVVDMADISILIDEFMTSGPPINKTALLLELQSRVDAINASLLDLEAYLETRITTLEASLVALESEVATLEARVESLEGIIAYLGIIPNGDFEMDPTGTSFNDISHWNHSSYDAYGATYDENLEIVDDYYFSGNKSLYSYIKSNAGTPLHDSCVYQYLWTENNVGTTSDYISLWIGGDGYTTSSRYFWWIKLYLTDGTNTYSEKLRCDCWESNEGCCKPAHYDYYNATETGADGRTWKRYTRRIPDNLDKSNLTIKIEHLQRSWDWTSTSSWYRLDNIYFSDSQGNPLP